MRIIGIIGAGFSGIMAAVNLMHKSNMPLEIIIIDKAEKFNRGLAYNSYSDKHLLNVNVAKMSAFPDKPNHFLTWVLQQEDFKNEDPALIAASYVSRNLYGKYLTDIWEQANSPDKIGKNNVRQISAEVTDIQAGENGLEFYFTNSEKIEIDICLIATGNGVPSNPSIATPEFYKSKNYFQNPWNLESVSVTDQDQPILIIGNGLTMVDTVVGLKEHGFKNKIYSISPHGFNILPHRHPGFTYSDLETELRMGMSLYELTKLVAGHIRRVRKFGISAEPVVNSLRKHSQRIWQDFSLEEKKLFLRRFRHLWGAARHRLPFQVHDEIQKMRINGNLEIYAGKIEGFNETKSRIDAIFTNNQTKKRQKVTVSRVINCTGPKSATHESKNTFLKSCLIKGVLTQDDLKLGINADPETYNVIDQQGRKNDRIFTIGPNLRGVLWESTAVRELREQAAGVAEQILNSISRLEELEPVDN